MAQFLDSIAFEPQTLSEVPSNVSHLESSLPDDRIGRLQLAQAQILKLNVDIFDTLTLSDGFGNPSILTAFVRRLQDWFTTWKSDLCVNDDPFDEYSSSTPYDTSLILLLPYLFGLSLMYRKPRSCISHFASSFIAGILLEMSERELIIWLPHPVLTMFVMGTAENFSYSKGDPQLTESAYKDLGKLESAMMIASPANRDELLSGLRDAKDHQVESSQLNPMTTQEKILFKGINFGWCSVPRSYIASSMPVSR